MKEKSRRELVRSRSFQRINGLTQRTPVHKITTRFNAKNESIFILDSKSDKYHYTEWAQNGFERQDISHGVQRCPTLSHVVPRCPTLSHVVPRRPTVSHGVPRCPAASHGVPRRPTVSDGVPRCPTASHGVPRRPTVSHGVPRCPTVSHGAVQSGSSKILLAAFGDPNRTGA